MSIWSKVLVGLIFVATLPFFYLSVRLLKTNKAWRDNVNQYQVALRDMVQGRPGQQSIDALTEAVRQQSVKLHDVMVDRGRVWRNVSPERAFNANTGQGSVIIEAPAPHRIAPKMVLFAFDAGGYLGEFQAGEPGDKNVPLVPNLKMSDRQLKRLSSSPGNWTLHEVMPIDRHDVFAGLDKAALEQMMLPAERLNEYLRDGQPAAADDPPQRVVDGKYERQLTDYARLFHEMDRQIAVATDLKVAAQKDAASMEAAVADAKAQVAFHTAEIADLKGELARSQAERDLINAQYKALQTQLAKVRVDTKAEFQKSRLLAKQWAQIQTAAAADHE